MHLLVCLFCLKEKFQRLYKKDLEGEEVVCSHVWM